MGCLQAVCAATICHAQCGWGMASPQTRECLPGNVRWCCLWLCLYPRNRVTGYWSVSHPDPVHIPTWLVEPGVRGRPCLDRSHRNSYKFSLTNDCVYPDLIWCPALSVPTLVRPGVPAQSCVSPAQSPQSSIASQLCLREKKKSVCKMCRPFIE